MTSNLIVDQTAPGLDAEQKQQQLREQLATKLRPELVGRIDEVILFASLGKKHFGHLISKQTELLNRRLLKKQCRISLGPKLEKSLLERINAFKFGARALKRIYQNMVTDQVAKRLLVESASQGAWVLDFDDSGAYLWTLDTSSDFFLPEKAS